MTDQLYLILVFVLSHVIVLVLGVFLGAWFKYRVHTEQSPLPKFKRNKKPTCRIRGGKTSPGGET